MEGRKEHRDDIYGIESVQPNNYPYSFNRKSRWGNILQGGLVGFANGLNAGMVESSHLDGQAQNSISWDMHTGVQEELRTPLWGEKVPGERRGEF